MSDSTGFSHDFVVNHFIADCSANADLTPSSFFDQHPEINRQRFAPEVTIAHISARLKDGRPLHLQSYFDQFPSLCNHETAWKILNAAEPWLIENEGLGWRDQWQKRLAIPHTDKRVQARQNEWDHAPDHALKSGDRLLDFEIIKLVGRGTYGIVFLACNLVLGRNVALKVSRQSGNEGRALARLNHPNIVRVFGQHEADSRRLLEMEYIDGSSLDQWLAASKNQTRLANRAWYLDWSQQFAHTPSVDPSPVPPEIERPAEVAVWISLQLALGLQHAHQRGILHLDIKPANVLVGSNGAPLLTDFNVAFIDGQDNSQAIGGTINYMSPEQLQAYSSGDLDSANAIDLRADLYSLGIVLLELLGGEKIWGVARSANASSILPSLSAARLASPPEEVRRLPGVDHTLAAIVDKALKPKTSDRYQSASEFATDLSGWIAGRSNTFADNPSPWERCVRFVKRNKLAVCAGLLLVLVALGGIAGRAVSEQQRLRHCNQLFEKVDISLAAGRGSQAAEHLGAAKTQLEQLWIARWFDRASLAESRSRARQCSQQLNRFERFRFSSLFGQVSLLNIHQDDQHDAQILVEESLRTYGVMTNPHWQREAPFVNLPPPQKIEVAEYITELMLVSMIHSIDKTLPNAQQWHKVMERLPAEHAGLGIFQRIKNGTAASASEDFESGLGSSTDLEPISPPRPDDIGCFESYLWGVWATCRQDDRRAKAWYDSALQTRAPETGEKFWLRYRSGLTSQRLQSFDEAIRHYHVCLGMKPNFAWLPFNIGLIHVAAGHHTEAVQSLRRAIYLDPMLTAAYQALAAEHLAAGNFEAALQTCDSALTAGASSPNIERHRAKASLMLQNR